MRFLFEVELHQDAPAELELGRAVLEIRRSPSGITFTIKDGTNKTILTGQCEPDELIQMAQILGDSE